MILVAVLWPSPALLWLREPQICTTGRHLGSREARQFSCWRTAGSLKVSNRSWGSTSYASSPKCYFLLLLDIFYDRLFKRRNEIIEPWRGVYNIVLGESSLSSQFPSSTQIAAVSLAPALRCLCSRSLACVTSFPLPGQPMLIITPVFQTPLFPGDIFKKFQIHIPIRQSDSADGFSNNSYSSQERKERPNMCWQESPHSIFSWLLRQPDRSNIQNSDWGI